MKASKHLIRAMKGISRENRKKATFRKIVAENSPELMKTSHPQIQKVKKKIPSKMFKRKKKKSILKKPQGETVGH